MGENDFKKIVDTMGFRFPIAKISEDLEYSKGSVSQYYNGKKELSENFRKLFENYYKVNLQEKTTFEKSHQSEGKIINNEEYPNKGVFIIPIKGRGGLENAMFDEIMFKDLKKEYLTIKQPASNSSKWFKIEVEGISMDDGSKKSLSEGDWAYCESIGKQCWRDKFHVHKYDIFCFFHNERGIIFKKIKNQNLETGELILTSLHSNKKEFPDFKIKVSECSYICNVIKVLSEF